MLLVVFPFLFFLKWYLKITRIETLARGSVSKKVLKIFFLFVKKNVFWILWLVFFHEHYTEHELCNCYNFFVHLPIYLCIICFHFLLFTSFSLSFFKINRKKIFCQWTLSSEKYWEENIWKLERSQFLPT